MNVVKNELPSGIELEFSEDDRLFHYTSTEGLFGILQSGMLWATHFQFLNDAQECMRARRSLEHYLQGPLSRKIAALVVNKKIVVQQGSSVKEAAALEAVNVVKTMYEATLGNVDPFVFSAYLCAKSDRRRFDHGDLQHWATYGRGAGYAIQINPQRLKALFVGETKKYTHGGLFCSAVEYTDDVAPPSLKGHYDVIASSSELIIERIRQGQENDQELKEAIDSTFLPFVRIISFIKDSCFAHEHEGRIVFYRHKVLPQGRQNHLLKVLTKGSFAIPYIGLFEDSLFGPQTPIERVIIGPHPDRVRRRVALESYLASRNLGIEVTDSDLPYSPR